jgi:hypothetical protein
MTDASLNNTSSPAVGIPVPWDDIRAVWKTSTRDRKIVSAMEAEVTQLKAERKKFEDEMDVTPVSNWLKMGILSDLMDRVDEQIEAIEKWLKKGED